MSCGVGCRYGLDPELLRLCCRPAAIVLIGPLAWEPPYASDSALKRKKKQKPTNTYYDLYMPSTKDRAGDWHGPWPHTGDSVIRITDNKQRSYNDKIIIVITTISDTLPFLFRQRIMDIVTTVWIIQGHRYGAHIQMGPVYIMKPSIQMEALYCFVCFMAIPAAYRSSGPGTESWSIAAAMPSPLIHYARPGIKPKPPQWPEPL